jgi:opacity protein-like surface antigen
VLVGATSASAADLPAQIYTKAPAIADPGYNWTGAYVGGQAGARQTGSNWKALCFESGLVPDCNSAPRFVGNVQGLDSTGPQLGGYLG